MDKRTIPHDDLLDVLEMKRDLEQYIYAMLESNELNLGLSALMGATINSILFNCRNKEEAVFYRNAFVHMFNKSLLDITSSN